MRTVTAADANRQFSRILRDVQAGQSITVTSRGVPVAQIQPVEASSRAQSAAKSALLTRLKSQAPQGIAWTRNELYDDAPGV